MQNSPANNGTGIPKTTDVACETRNWLNLSPEQIDEYLNYDGNDSLETKLRSTIPVAAKTAKMPRVYVHNARVGGGHVRIKTSVGRIDYRLRTGKTSGSNGYSCPKHMNVDPERWCGYKVTQSEFHMKAFLAFGKTMSPLLNNILGQKDQCPAAGALTLPDIDIHMFLDAMPEFRKFCTDLYSQNCDLRAGFPKLRRLHSRLISFAGVGFLRFLTAVAHIALSVRNFAKDPGLAVCFYLSRLEQCYKPRDVVEDPFADFDVPSTCRALVILASPGSGKSQFLNGFHFGFIDTDWINTDALNKDPSILDRLSLNGIPVMTNRWEWKKWTTPFVYIKTFEFGRRIWEKTKPTQEMRSFTQAKRDALVKRVAELRVREWTDAYEGIEDRAFTIHLTSNQCLLHGFGVLLDIFLTDKY